MPRKPARHLTYANVMATVAVFIAMGGTGYAAGLWGGEDIRDGSLKGVDVHDHSLTGADVRTHSLGPRRLVPGAARANLGSFNAISGLPCRDAAGRGTIWLSWDQHGTAVLICESPRERLERERVEEPREGKESEGPGGRPEPQPAETTPSPDRPPAPPPSEPAR